MYWDSGLENAPEVVKTSFHSWVHMNPDYEVKLLTDSNIREYVGFEFNDVKGCFSVDLGKAGMSDLLRLYLLYHFGGVWADATTFCLKPLSDWLDITDTGFFCFRQPKRSFQTPNVPKERQLVSWFMAGEQGNELILDLLEQCLIYLTQTRSRRLKIRALDTADFDRYDENIFSRENTGFKYLEMEADRGHTPYFWMFYIFNEICKTKRNKKNWEKIQKKTNKYINHAQSFSLFHHGFVSKQTYKKMQSIEILKERTLHVMELCKNATL